MPEDSHIRGIVQISHGMCEYFSRYTAFAKYLCGLGFIVCGNDHIGHGASVSRPADLGFFAAHDGWKYLIQDVLHLRELMHRRYPDLPYFMLGHSMGSLIVRLCLSECGTELAGAILIGTAGPNAAALSAAHVADSIARTRGVTFRSGLLNSIAFKAYNRRIDHPNSVFDWLSRDEEVVSLYQSDEKCNFIFTASAFRDLFILCARANSNATFRRTPSDLPLFFLAGDCDPVGRYGDGVRRVLSLYRAGGSRNIDAVFTKTPVTSCSTSSAASRPTAIFRAGSRNASSNRPRRLLPKHRKHNSTVKGRYPISLDTALFVFYISLVRQRSCKLDVGP